MTHELYNTMVNLFQWMSLKNIMLHKEKKLNYD